MSCEEKPPIPGSGKRDAVVTRPQADAHVAHSVVGRERPVGVIRCGRRLRGRREALQEARARRERVRPAGVQLERLASHAGEFTRVLLGAPAAYAPGACERRACTGPPASHSASGFCSRQRAA
jgi:hypothetical protein